MSSFSIVAWRHVQSSYRYENVVYSPRVFGEWYTRMSYRHVHEDMCSLHIDMRMIYDCTWRMIYDCRISFSMSSAQVCRHSHIFMENDIRLISIWECRISFSEDTRRMKTCAWRHVFILRVSSENEDMSPCDDSLHVVAWRHVFILRRHDVSVSTTQTYLMCLMKTSSFSEDISSAHVFGEWRHVFIYRMKTCLHSPNVFCINGDISIYKETYQYKKRHINTKRDLFIWFVRKSSEN